MCGEVCGCVGGSEPATVSPLSCGGRCGGVVWGVTTSRCFSSNADLHKLTLMREFDLLKNIFAHNQSLGDAVVIPPGDDMAELTWSGRNLLVAVDQIVDGRHINLSTTPLELVGRKAIARSVSDIAAMAAKPVASLAAVVLPKNFQTQQAQTLSKAMIESAREFECPLIGGDLAFHNDPAHPLICSVTVLAEPMGKGEAQSITRSGAKTGDAVYITGQLGGAIQIDGSGKHLTFSPRVKEAQLLLSKLGSHLHAMIDISDGLGRDVSHIAELSNVQIHLDAAAIPCTNGLPWQNALSDGEDYELCFTTDRDPPSTLAGLPVTEVGRVEERANADDPYVLVHDAGQTHIGDESGWQHES